MQRCSTTAALAAILLTAATAASAAAPGPVFDAPDTDYKAQIWANAVGGGARVPGATLEIGGEGFKPGQRIQFSRGLTPLLPSPITADAQGRISGTWTIPADAVPGVHPIVLTTESPYYAEVLPLKLSQVVPLLDNPRLRRTDAAVAPGLYQLAYSTQQNALYATSATGYPPNERSRLLEIDPQTLKIRREVTVATMPGDAGAAGAYGIGLDETRGNLWVTNTRQDALAVYDLKTLSLKKQFEKGSARHSRDVVIDAQRGRAYVSLVRDAAVAVFDARTLEPLPSIAIPPAGKEVFSPASLSLDADSGTLYVSSLTGAEIAVIDGPAGKVVRRIPVPGADSTIGLDVDAKGGKAYVAAQGSDNLVVLDLKSGNVLHDVTVGSGALNVVYEPSQKLAYVVSRAAGTITVVDGDGKIVANLGDALKANHLIADGKGHVFVVDKSGQGKDTDDITRLEWAAVR